MALNIFPFAKQCCTVCILKCFVLGEEFVCIRSHVVLHLFAMTIADASVTSEQTTMSAAKAKVKKTLQPTSMKIRSRSQLTISVSTVWRFCHCPRRSRTIPFGNYARLFRPFTQFMIISITTSHVTIVIASHETVAPRI
jgi:hypothetical protein